MRSDPRARNRTPAGLPCPARVRPAARWGKRLAIAVITEMRSSPRTALGTGLMSAGCPPSQEAPPSGVTSRAGLDQLCWEELSTQGESGAEGSGSEFASAQDLAPPPETL